MINTGSRLIPLSLAWRSLADHQSAAANDIRQMIQDNRLRLMQLAGPGARFTWWGEDGNGDAFLTAWAWYADWQASQALGVTQQPEYWQHMLDSYAEQADNMPLLHRALVLAWAQEMNLPCKTLLKGLDEAIARRGTKDEDFSEEDIRDINKDIKVGLARSNGKYIEIDDRKEAIAYCMVNAQPGDMIVLLGKGHEDYQEIRGVKYHFDEREAVAEVLDEIKEGKRTK